MAALPSPTQVAGSQYGLYEAYYRLVDPNNAGTVGAADAAKFLKKSGLSDIILGKIWDLSDPGRKGFLYKPGFFVALKLVSLAQAGHPTTMDNIVLDLPPPKLGDIKVTPVTLNNVPPPVPPATIAPGDWAMKDPERMKYEQLFESLQPVNNRIQGNKVRGVLMESKLPLDTLGKIWDLADMDKDGMLDRHEFVVAMHLVYKALEKHSIPNVLPAELLPPGKRKPSGVAPPPVPPAPAAAVIAPMTSLPQQAPLPVAAIPSMTAPPTVPLTSASPVPPSSAPLVVPWVVTPEERARYNILFHQTDIDKDGFVSGAEIKDVFLQSGVPQAVLANIWSLCDSKTCGKLNNEQFALAMWLINQKLKGIDPPRTLSPEMIPPSERAKTDAQGEITTVTPYSNPELDMISRDIDELSREKRQLESEIAQKEADIAHKNSEVKSLQSELDTLAATLRQLENQKGEAQKRLNDLKTQTESVEKELKGVLEELDDETNKVDKLRVQATEQEAVLKTQEDELMSKKQELEGLKQEETRLAQQQDSFRQRLDTLTKGLQDSQLHISQAKAKISQLQEQRRQMSDAIALYDTAINTGDASGVPDWSLHIEPEFRDPDIKKLIMVNGMSPSNENAEDLSNGKDPFSNHNGPVENKKEKKSLFDDDPTFRPTKATNDPFAATNDPFAGSGFGKDGFSSDPFNAFGSSNTASKRDPFASDPFGDSSRSGAKSPADPEKDAFGCDPFAILHAPTAASAGATSRPESPSPALPPKKSKQPPPRPAPPRPSTGPTMRPAPTPTAPSPNSDPARGADESFGSDPFGGSGGAGGFADFANFDNKFSDPVDSRVSTPAQAFSSPGSVTSASATESVSRYATFEFTEDPFGNYRYEDPFNISDPFDDDKNGNLDSSTNSTDPFGLAASPATSEKFSQPLTDSLFGDDFTQSLGNAKQEPQKHKTKSVDDMSNNNTPKSTRSTKSNESEKSSKEKKHFWNKNASQTLDNHHKSKDSSFFTSKFLRRSGTHNGADFGGGNMRLGEGVSEDQQLSWAAAESLRMEEDRRRRQEQENNELALALEISKQEANSRRVT